MFLITKNRIPIHIRKTALSSIDRHLPENSLLTYNPFNRSSKENTTLTIYLEQTEKWEQKLTEKEHSKSFWWVFFVYFDEWELHAIVWTLLSIRIDSAVCNLYRSASRNISVIWKQRVYELVVSVGDNSYTNRWRRNSFNQYFLSILLLITVWL